MAQCKICGKKGLSWRHRPPNYELVVHGSGIKHKCSEPLKKTVKLDAKQLTLFQY